MLKTLVIAALKPRNPVARALTRSGAGRHAASHSGQRHSAARELRRELDRLGDADRHWHVT